MKLRNKKTGDIVDSDKLIEELERRLADRNIYEPLKEPLIKDEKVRKAVRAWAEAEEIEKVFLCDDLVWGEPMVRIAEDTVHHEISFKGSLKIKCGAYTITELCGEKE